jgi:hypothetical protein
MPHAHRRDDLLAMCSVAYDGGRLSAPSRDGPTVVDLSTLAAGAPPASKDDNSISGSGSRQYKILQEGAAGGGVAAILQGCFGLARM